MVAAVRVHKVGGPEVLTFEEIDVPAPGQGQLRVKQYACGVNFIDTYFRMGMYPSPVGLPFVAGNEGAGEVVAVGPTRSPKRFCSCCRTRPLTSAAPFSTFPGRADEAALCSMPDCL